MAITTMDGVVAAISGGQNEYIYKAAVTAEGAGTWHSHWKTAGNPTAGATPAVGAGVAPTKATTGAFIFTNPGASITSYLLQLSVQNTSRATIRLYDRLVHTSGLSGTSTVSQTVNSAAITRPDALGAGTELWLEFYSAIGATGATLTVTYTNQDGTASRTGTYVHPANAESVGQMVPVTLQSGDTGVRSVQSVIWSVSTGTLGDFGIVILRHLAFYPIISADSSGEGYDFARLGMPRIYDDACIAIAVFASGTSTGAMTGQFVIGQG